MVVGGCGSDQGIAEPIAYDELVSKMAEAACSGLGTCCNHHGFSFDRSSCESSFVSRVEPNLPSLERISYDGQAAGQCLEQARSVYANCGTGDRGLADACEKVFTGTQPAGAPCQNSEECATAGGSEAWCDRENETTEGVCVVEPAAARGALKGPCNGSCVDGSCSGIAPQGELILCHNEDGLYCELTSRTCQPTQAEGGPCDSSEACHKDLYCDSASGACSRKKPDGAACTEWDECVNRCDRETSETPGVCVPELMVDAELCASGEFGD